MPFSTRLMLGCGMTQALRTRNTPVTGVLLLDISLIFQLSTFNFPLSSLIFHLEFPRGLHPKDYRHKMRCGSEVDEQMPYQMVVAEGLHRVEYCADGVEYST